MTRAPISLGRLAVQVADLYRPAPRGHWQNRIERLIGEWLGRADTRLSWTEEAEATDRSPVRLDLPGRTQAPRWIGLDSPLDGHARLVASVLVQHVGLAIEALERHIGPPERTMPLRWRQALTARQMQVAMLAAVGQQNEQIADQLGIAPRTVARLLQEVYRRLNLKSRAELAAECALGRPPTPAHQRIPDLSDDASEDTLDDTLDEPADFT